MYGAQVVRPLNRKKYKFENDVNVYGTQAMQDLNLFHLQFENDVNMYGTQAVTLRYIQLGSLRMM